MKPGPYREQVAGALRHAAAIVERGWTQYVYARNGAGNAVDPRDTDAVSWCAVGAIASMLSPVKGFAHKSVVGATSAFSMHISGEYGASLPYWNDEPGRTGAEVAAAMRACADRVERGEL